MAKEKKTYYDYLLGETDKEKAIWAEINEERKRFEESAEYIEHDKKLDELLNKLKEAKNERLQEAHKHRRHRKAKSIDLESTEFKKVQEEKRLARMESYSKNLRESINLFDTLTEEEKSAFNRETFVRSIDREKFENPQTTKQDMKELLEILVQTTIDFINERGLKDIDAVGFYADSLQESSKYSEWTSATDASIRVYGQEKKVGSDGNEYYVENLIGEYF